jgi:hypothetical protein
MDTDQKSIMLSIINDHKDILLAGIKTTQDNLDATTRLLNEYMRDEKQKSKELANKIKICGNVFEKLTHSADLAREKAESLNTKLSLSCAALEISENQGALLADINTNFTKIFNERTIEVNKKIQRILDGLADIAYKCSWFQNFPKPYKTMIALYNAKIESVLQVLDSRKNNLLCDEHIESEKSIEDVKQEIKDVTLQVPDSKKKYRRKSMDVVESFNIWAANPTGPLPDGFTFLEGDPVMEGFQYHMTETSKETKWITNRNGLKKYLFPNPNFCDTKTKITMFYKMDLESVLRVKPSGNKIKIKRPCEIYDSIIFPGKLELL